MINTGLKIAVFIDFDNIEIGVKTTLNLQLDVAAVLDGIKERGEIVTKVAYGDWKRAGEYGRLLSQHAIRMVQRTVTPGGDKNGADINLALDALEMAFTHHHINAFVIVGGDSDFITLVEKLKQYDKKVFVVGGRQFTSVVMQRNCHEFIAYENLVAARRPQSGERRQNGGTPATVEMEQSIPLVKRALKVLADREVSPQLGLLKSTLLQLDSTFSERTYGTSTFRDFIEKVAKTGAVTLRHSGRSIMVDLPENGTPGDAAGGMSAASAPSAPSAGTVTAATPAFSTTPAAATASAAGTAPAAAAPSKEAHQGTPTQQLDPERLKQAAQHVREIFEHAAQPPRWPMYARQVKQYLRANDPSFDEQVTARAAILDLLRQCQRDGLLRLERDRRGQMRVFPGAAFPAETAPPQEAVTLPPQVDVIEMEEMPGGEEISVAEISPDPVMAVEAEEIKVPRARRPRAGGGTRKRTGTSPRKTTAAAKKA